MQQRREICEIVRIWVYACVRGQTEWARGGENAKRYLHSVEEWVHVNAERHKSVPAAEFSFTLHGVNGTTKEVK